MDRPHDVARRVRDAESQLADANRLRVFTHREMIRRPPDVRRDNREDVAHGAVRLTRTGQFPRLVDAGFALLNVTATKVYEPDPNEEPRQQRPLSKRTGHLDGAVAERHGVLPITDACEILD